MAYRAVPGWGTVQVSKLLSNGMENGTTVVAASMLLEKGKEYNKVMLELENHEPSGRNAKCLLR
jgi:hypothetical protein